MQVGKTSMSIYFSFKGYGCLDVHSLGDLFGSLEAPCGTMGTRRTQVGPEADLYRFGEGLGSLFWERVGHRGLTINFLVGLVSRHLFYRSFT